MIYLQWNGISNWVFSTPATQKTFVTELLFKIALYVAGDILCAYASTSIDQAVFPFVYVDTILVIKLASIRAIDVAWPYN
jgi:hypothetical protein